VRKIILDDPSYGIRFISQKIDQPTFKPNAAINGRLSLANVGNGKATIADSICGIIKSGPPDRLPREFQKQQGSLTILIAAGTGMQPGEIVECTFAGQGPTLEQYRQAYSTDNPPPSGIQFYVTGWIDYRDELGLTRRTGFCQHYVPELDRFFP
jgi:hypothetical protein